MEPLTLCQINYIKQLQSIGNSNNCQILREKLRMLPSNYRLPFYEAPEDHVFILTWQRVPLCIVDPEHSNLINIIKDLARKEATINTDPIPKESILGTALIALGLEQEYKLIDIPTKILCLLNSHKVSLKYIIDVN
jgi:hypothetical protein